MEVLPLLIAGIFGAAAFFGAWQRRRARRSAWHRAAGLAGLTGIVERDSFLGGSLEGRTEDSLHVRLESYRRGKHESGTRVTVSCLGRPGSNLSLRREGLSTAFDKRFVRVVEVEVGCRRFDREHFIEGPGPLVMALLDHETRQQLAVLFAGRLWVDGRTVGIRRASLQRGVLQVEVRGPRFFSPEQRLPEVLRGLLALARRLVPPEDVAARIAENVRGEPEEGVRLRAVLTLAREFPDDPATRETLLAAREDPSDEVRLRAAMALGEEGRGTLLALVTDERADDACSAAAVAALGEGVRTEILEMTLRSALAAARRQTACVCLQVLGKLGGPGAQALMLEALQDPATEVGVAAARALGRAGTVAAVAPLLEAGSRAELRKAARQAVAEIQSRLAGAEPGQLSLARTEAGALSLVDSDFGQLSLAQAEESVPHRSPEGEGAGGDTTGETDGTPRVRPRALEGPDPRAR